MKYPQVQVLGTSIDSVDSASVGRRIAVESARGIGGVVVTPNVDHLRRLRRSRGADRFATSYENADLVVADGAPLVFAAALEGRTLTKVTGHDVLEQTCRFASLSRVPVLLVGGGEGAAERAADSIGSRFAHLVISGDSSVRVSVDDPQSIDNLSELVAGSDARVIFLGVGSPKQEVAADELSRRHPDRWFVCVGAAIDVAGGLTRRPPRWMQSAGLEWVWRLAGEPRRLAKRYVSDVPTAFAALCSAIVERFVGRHSQMERAIARSFREAVEPSEQMDNSHLIHTTAPERTSKAFGLVGPVRDRGRSGSSGSIQR